MEKQVYELKIDPDLEKVAPQLKCCELEMLKEDLLANGCVTPLIVWGGVLVDGHARYRICHEYGIPFAIEQMDFGSRSEVKAWIIEYHLGRRNLTPFQKCEMVMPFEAELRAEAEKRRVEAISKYRSTGVKSGQNKRTREILADMAGISTGTLDKVKTILEIGDEETKRRLRAGEISVHFAYTKLTKKQRMPMEPAQSLDDAAYLIKALIEDLSTKDMDKEAIISILTDISEILEKR